MKQALINFYLDYFNNYLTVAVLAEQYGIEKEDCQTLIHIGRKLYNAQAERNKHLQEIKNAPKNPINNPYTGMGIDDILGHMAKQVTDILNKQP